MGRQSPFVQGGVGARRPFTDGIGGSRQRQPGVVPTAVDAEIPPDIYWDFETPGEFGALGSAANKGTLPITAISHSTPNQTASDHYAGTQCMQFDNGTAYFGTDLGGSPMLDFAEAIIQYAVKPYTGSPGGGPDGPQVHFCWDTDINNRFILYMVDRVPTLYVRRGGGTAVVFGVGLSATMLDAWSLWRWELIGGEIELFINGVSVASVADGGAYTQAIFGNPVAWGRVAFAADAWFTGRMDEFKMWRLS